MTGEQLKRYMEWSASYYNQYKDGDLTISFNPEMRGYLYDMFAGVRYDINISKPAGERIENLTYDDGTTVNPSDIVYLTSNDYRTSTKLLDDLYKDENVEVVHKSADTEIGAVRDLVREYIINVKGGVITPDTDNNWKITGCKFDNTKRDELIKLVNEGKVQVPTSEDGRTYNTRSITWDEIKGLVPVVDDEVKNDEESKKENNTGANTSTTDKKNEINKNKTGSNIKENDKLPKTGQKHGSSDMVIAGTVLIATSFIGYFSYKKRKKHNA